MGNHASIHSITASCLEWILALLSQPGRSSNTGTKLRTKQYEAHTPAHAPAAQHPLGPCCAKHLLQQPRGAACDAPESSTPRRSGVATRARAASQHPTRRSGHDPSLPHCTTLLRMPSRSWSILQPTFASCVRWESTTVDQHISKAHCCGMKITCTH